MTDRIDRTPPPDTLPSASTLWRATAVAGVVAVVLAVAVVLPAENGYDPTGVGEALGLAEMGRVKVALAAEAEADAAREATARAEAETLLAGSDAGPRADTNQITLAPGESAEVKLVMRADARAAYRWSTSRGRVTYDLHANRVGPGTPRFIRYGSGETWSRQGTLTAAFAGRHGWYWQNPTSDTLTVTLHTSGAYLGLR